jgi:ABC-2 type transport system permease protein
MTPVTVLLLRLWRQHRLTLAVLAAAAALFHWVLTQVAPEPGELGFFGGLSALLPPQLTALIGGESGLASPRGVIGFGYLHPFFLTLMTAWTIRVTSAALAGELGRGTMDLLASRPASRESHVMAAWTMTVGGLAVMASAAWAGSAVGLAMRSIGVGPREIVLLPVMALLLFTAWAGVALFVSATRREAGPAIAWASAIIAVSFVWDFLARVWTPAGWTRPVSLFAYYRPQEVVAAGVAARDVVTLTMVAAAALAAALIVFRRRES